MKNIKGITLISLVITIIILIILVGIGITLSLGENGIFIRSKQAKEETNKQTATEIINLKITNCQMNMYAEKQRMPTLKELSKALIDDEIEYVTEKSQVASTKYEVGENPSSIFTKLNKYPYEFEINSSLQLASIDGIKIATTANSQATLENTMSGKEHFIGEYYFNGKPIYEKTVKIPFPNAVDYFSANHNITDVDNIWFNNSKCFVKAGVVQSLGLPYALPNHSIALHFVNRTTISLNTEHERYSAGWVAYITVDYTKLTDEPTKETDIDILTLN